MNNNASIPKTVTMAVGWQIHFHFLRSLFDCRNPLFRLLFDLQCVAVILCFRSALEYRRNRRIYDTLAFMNKHGSQLTESFLTPTGLIKIRTTKSNGLLMASMISCTFNLRSESTIEWIFPTVWDVSSSFGCPKKKCLVNFHNYLFRRKFTRLSLFNSCKTQIKERSSLKIWQESTNGWLLTGAVLPF